jgi:uncharacterized membrane protein YphA (DoxX/SURF4 family)
VHGQYGFFMGSGPDSKLSEAGFEYNLALIGLLLPIFLAGPGNWAIARFVMPKSKKTGRPILFLE